MLIVFRLQYSKCYNNSPVAIEFGHLDPHPYAKHSQYTPHQHEVFLTQEGDIEPCRYWEDIQTNVDECIYEPSRFGRESNRPKYWPAFWKYPKDPQNANFNERGPYPECEHCGKHIVCSPVYQQAYEPRGLLCLCGPEDFCVKPLPLLEIVQFDSYRANDSLAVNRGVRALSSISEGDILGEYIGDIIPNDSDDWWFDPTYTFSLPGPRQCLRKTWKSDKTNICTVSGGWNGNWTRYMNHKDRYYQVSFETEPIGGKTRIIAKAIRDIQFGEEIYTNYGKVYFSKDALENSKKRGFRKRRRG